MKKRTSKMSRRIVSLLMSIVLTLTLVTPAAFAAEVVDGSSTTIVEGNTNPADANPSGDNEGKNDVDKDTEDGGDEQPTNPGDEDKNPTESEGDGNGDDANKPAEDNKDEEKPDEDKKDEENKDKQSTEDENDGEDEIALLNDENGTDVWGGESDIAEKFAGGTGTESDPYQISNGAQLAYLAQQVNAGTNYSGEYFKLTSDIQLNELDDKGMPRAAEGQTGPHPWTPIGNSSKKFQGTFDGDGHTIAGLYINDTAAVYNAYKGLFGNITAGAKVQNLVVTGDVMAKSANNTAPQYVGGIVGFNNGTVQNCGFQGSVSASKKNSAPSTNNNGGVRWDIVAKNPFDNTTLPKVKRKSREIWDAATIRKALDECKDGRLYVAINLSFACSLRIGEIVGLTWDNIHISDADIANDNAYLCVEKELARVKESSLAILGEEEIIKKFPRTMYLENASTVIVLKTPKTESSVRKVWMPKTVAYILREWKDSQDKQKEFLGDEYLDYNLVVALPNGRPCEETVISNAFRRLKRDAKLPNVVFHSLRHSSTTYKLKLNHGDIKATQGDTGHSQADMVTKVYAHILDEDRKVNAQKFESAFYANPDLRSVKAPDEPQTALDVQSIIVQLQQSPELLSALTSLISNQGCK